MDLIIIVFIWVLMGLWCKSLAEKRGLNEFVAFACGLMFSVFAVIIYACLSETTEHKVLKQIEYEKALKLARLKK